MIVFGPLLESPRPSKFGFRGEMFDQMLIRRSGQSLPLTAAPHGDLVCLTTSSRLRSSGTPLALLSVAG